MNIKNLFKISIASIAMMTLFSGCFGGNNLQPFGAEMGKKNLPIGGPLRIPYTNVINYFGYADANMKPDAIVKGKKFNYIYVWIPAAAPELGVRMISPVLNQTPKDSA